MKNTSLLGLGIFIPLDVEWDLTNEHGVKYKGGSFDGVFHVTLPNYNSPYAPSKKRINKPGG
jgi:hypothetical protein